VSGRRLGQAAGILFLGLLGLEVALRGGGLLAAAFFSRASPPVEAPGVTVLCVGDSHTYGAPLPREQSYPAQLQQALDAQFSSPRFAVVNLGVPGVNSAFVANRLPRQILELRPAAVVAWVGWNNQWNALETEAWGPRAPWPSTRLLFHLRVFRLASAVWYTRAGRASRPAEYEGSLDGWHYFRLGGERVPIPSGERGPGWFPAPPRHDELVAGLAFDLARMAATAEALSVPILFVNYPFSARHPLPRAYAEVHSALRAAAQPLGLELLDTGLDLERAQEAGLGIDELLVDAMGPHPTGRLYAEVVGSLVPRLVARLRAAHGVAVVRAAPEAPRPGGSRSGARSRSGGSARGPGGGSGRVIPVGPR
jgi:hypothetical protein